MLRWQHFVQSPGGPDTEKITLKSHIIIGIIVSVTPLQSVHARRLH